MRAAELDGIYIPFAHRLADLVPASLLRMRRDYRQLLTMIEAIALMHLEQRELQGNWLVATDADYEAARKLLAPLLDTLATEGLTQAVRETVLAVKKDEIDVTQTELAQRLKLSRGTVSWRVRRALDGGWLVDDSPQTRDSERPRSRSMRLRRGEPLPADTSVLPTAERLFECSNAKTGTDRATQHAVPEGEAVDGQAEAQGQAANSGSSNGAGDVVCRWCAGRRGPLLGPDRRQRIHHACALESIDQAGQVDVDARRATSAQPAPANGQRPPTTEVEWR
jgi:hypothetical protein